MIEVGERIEAAETPPGTAYVDPDIFRAELEKIFTSAWIPLSPRIAEPGFVEPIELLPGALDEPLLLSVDLAGSRRCLSNVCTHRGMKLVSESGPAKRIRCGYHGRRFALDGTLHARTGPDLDERRDHVGWIAIATGQLQDDGQRSRR